MVGTIQKEINPAIFEKKFLGIVGLNPTCLASLGSPEHHGFTGLKQFAKQIVRPTGHDWPV